MLAKLTVDFYLLTVYIQEKYIFVAVSSKQIKIKTTNTPKQMHSLLSNLNSPYSTPSFKNVFLWQITMKMKSPSFSVFSLSLHLMFFDFWFFIAVQILIVIFFFFVKTMHIFNWLHFCDGERYLLASGTLIQNFCHIW